jgi:hypothetical protein
MIYVHTIKYFQFVLIKDNYKKLIEVIFKTNII